MGTRYFCAALLLAGCSDQAKPDTSAAASSSTAGALVVVASATPPALPVDHSPIAVKVDGEVLPLTVVGYNPAAPFMPGAQASPALRIFPFPTTMIVMQAGQLFELEAGKLKLNAKAVTTEKIPKATPVVGASEIYRFEGVYPDKLYVTASYSSFMGARQASERTVQYVRSGGAWAESGALPRSLTGWRSGSVVTLDGAGKLVADTTEVKLPSQTPGTDGKCSPGSPLVVGRQVAGLPTGELLVLGSRCDTSATAVEWWPAAGQPSTIEDLPGAPRAEAATSHLDYLRVGSDKSAYVVLTRAGNAPYVARFDGRGFRPLEIPDRGDVRGAWATPDGALFFVLRGERGRRSTKDRVGRLMADGRYTRWEPTQAHPLGDLWAPDSETVYVSLSSLSSSEGAIFGIKPGKLTSATAPEAFTQASPSAPTPAEKPAAPGETPTNGAAAFPKYDDACKDPFVFLYDVGANTPATFAFPATVKALLAFAKATELELVDFKHGGKRRLGVRVPNQDVAAELVKHVKTLMPDDKPELVCFKTASDARKVALSQ